MKLQDDPLTTAYLSLTPAEEISLVVFDLKEMSAPKELLSKFFGKA
jgi:hypothetical protein